MSIKINIHKIFQRFANDQQEAKVKGHTVEDCLKDLIRQFPALEGKLLDKKGRLLNNIEIYINQASAYPNELKKAVSSGDTINIILMIDGG
jgi:molybdopterin converting factor small subunit